MKKIDNLIAIFVVLLILASNPPWFIWGFNYYLVALSSFAIITIQLYRLKKLPQNVFLFLSLYILAFSYFVLIKGFYELRLSSFIFFITLISCYLLTSAQKIISFNLLTKMYGYSLGLSLLIWLYHQFIHPLPFSFPLDYAGYWGKQERLTFNHYIFFIQPQLDYIRFYSFFDEPGVVGTLSTFILYSQRYNFKKPENLLILIASIFTYSLVFYILTLFGILFTYIIERRFKATILLGIIAFISSGFLLSIQSFRLAVIERFLDFDNLLSRRTGVISDQFYDEFIETNEALYGKPLTFLTTNNSIVDGQSYKFFIIEYGLIGLFLIFLIYLYFTVRHKSIFVFVLFLMFIASFIQRPFLFTPWQILLFVIASDYVKKAR